MATTDILSLVFVTFAIACGGKTIYPHKAQPGEIIYSYKQGARFSFTVDPSNCQVLDQSTPSLKNYSFGGDIGHSRYVLYGPLNNLTYWTQRYVDNRDVKRIGPVLRETGIEMDATGYAYVFIDDYDPDQYTKLAHLHMLCASYKGFLPYAQTPGGTLMKFDDVIDEISKGSMLFYSIYPSWCDPVPTNYTHISIDVGPIDEYRFDEQGHLVFTYRSQQRGLRVYVTTLKMTSSSDVTMETYTYSQIDNKSSQLQVKTCHYGESHMFGIYKMSSPEK